MASLLHIILTLAAIGVISKGPFVSCAPAEPLAVAQADNAGVTTAGAKNTVEAQNAETAPAQPAADAETAAGTQEAAVEAANTEAETAAAGVPAAKALVAGAHVAGAPAAGAPVAGVPAAETPAAGEPAAGAPAAGALVAGAPDAGAPAAGAPAAGAQAAGEPAAGAPAAKEGDVQGAQALPAVLPAVQDQGLQAHARPFIMPPQAQASAQPAAAAQAAKTEAETAEAPAPEAPAGNPGNVQDAQAVPAVLPVVQDQGLQAHARPFVMPPQAQEHHSNPNNGGDNAETGNTNEGANANGADGAKPKANLPKSKDLLVVAAAEGAAAGAAAGAVAGATKGLQAVNKAFGVQTDEN